jgi:hypothetical protein
MIRAITIAAALMFATTAGAAPTLDAKGKCRDNGKFVAASMCKAAATPAKQVCKDAKGKFAKCGTPGAAPVKK